MFTTDLPQPDAPTSLTELVERARAMLASGRRSILGIAGTPGAGKSTVTEALQEALGEQAAVVGMDGFHLSNATLERLGRRARKGAPDTFDVNGYVALLSRLSAPSPATIYAPRFDRDLEEPIAGAVAVAPDVRLVITEGNYLLSDTGGWERVRPLLDQAWYLDVDEGERRRRLIARRRGHGHPHEEAVAWVQDVDEPNAHAVELTRRRADLVVRLDTDPEPSGPLSRPPHEGDQR